MKTTIALLLALAIAARAALPPGAPSPAPSVGGEYKSENLYTPPAPGAGGGIHFSAPVPMTMALAVPQGNQELVYKAKLSPDKKDATFVNLPIARYDLVILAQDHYYEGIALNRDEDALSTQDIASVDEIFSRSVPFFNQKRTERIKGTPGDQGKASAVVQWRRTSDGLLNQNGVYMKGHEIRTFRIVFLANVGPGWQVTATRELIRTDVFPDQVHGFIPVDHIESLGGIRVIDTLKDIGPVTLQTPAAKEAKKQ